MSWRAINEVKAFGTPQGPERFKDVFKPTGRKGARGRGYSAKKALLLALADKHLWPNVSKDAPVQITYADLAEVLACSVDTIKRNADWLDKAGLAIHEYAHDERGRRASNRFFINFDGVDRDDFAAAVLGKVVPRRLSPTGQNALKEGHLKGNMHAPKGQYAGDQYLKTVRDGKREGGLLPLNAIFQDGAPPSDWFQWCAANFVATSADIARSADRFYEHFASKVLTPEGWFAKWRKWCKGERHFVSRRTWTADEAGTVVRPAAPERDPQQRLRIEMKQLELWIGGVSWDDRLGPAPKSPTDAQARIAELEARISEDFRTSPPSERASHEQRVVPCG
jgi:hypothetical protein